MHGSLPTRGAWIEIENVHGSGIKSRSLPTRGAWIEIVESPDFAAGKYVAPHTGSVD